MKGPPSKAERAKKEKEGYVWSAGTEQFPFPHYLKQVDENEGPLDWPTFLSMASMDKTKRAELFKTMAETGEVNEGNVMEKMRNAMGTAFDPEAFFWPKPNGSETPEEPKSAEELVKMQKEIDELKRQYSSMPSKEELEQKDTTLYNLNTRLLEANKAIQAKYHFTRANYIFNYNTDKIDDLKAKIAKKTQENQKLQEAKSKLEAQNKENKKTIEELISQMAQMKLAQK